jgi:hypothetical protein
VQARLNETQSKNKLYFGNLPRAYTQKQLEDELKKTCKGARAAAAACAVVAAPVGRLHF